MSRPSLDGHCTNGSFDEEGKFPDSLTADDYRAAGVEKIYVGFYWPEGMLRAIQAQASPPR